MTRSDGHILGKSKKSTKDIERETEKLSDSNEKVDHLQNNWKLTDFFSVRSLSVVSGKRGSLFTDNDNEAKTDEIQNPSQLDEHPPKK